MGIDKKKYLLSKKSYLQYELAVVEEELNGGASEETSDDVADGPANGAVAKQAAARAAAAKAKTKAKPEPEAEDDGLDFLDATEEESNEPTEDDVKVSVKKFVAAFGKEKVVALLGKFKAKAIQDIKAKDYAAFIDLVTKALAKHKK
jgi:hypothetical protein